MITKLDEALSICVVLGTLTQQQASTISALCEQSLTEYRRLNSRGAFVKPLAEVIDTAGALFIFKQDILDRIDLITLNSGKETIQ